MNRRFVLGLAAGLGLLLLPTAPRAEVGEAAYHFLNLGSSARLEALGETGATLARGADAVLWNPARLGRLSAPSVSVAAYNWLQDVQGGHLAAALPVGRGALGLAVRSLRVAEFGNVEGEGQISQSDVAVSLSGAYPLLRRLDVGATGHFVRSSVAEEDATGWALDGGLDYAYVEGWNVAAAVRNAGPGFGYGDGVDEKLPTQSVVGVGGTLRELRFGAEGLWENGPGWRGQFGAEYPLFGDRLALRAGTRLGDDTDRAMDPWSVGAGLAVPGNLDVDYSFRNGTLEGSHRVGIRWVPDRSLGDGAQTALSPRAYFVSVVNEVLEQALVDFPRDQVDTLRVIASGDDRGAKVIGATIVDRLNAMGMPAVEGPPVPAEPNTGNPEQDALALEAMKEQGLLDGPSGPQFVFEVRESEYEILRERRERWIGPRSLERQARVELGCMLKSVDGEVLWTSSGQASRSQFIAANRIPPSDGFPRPGGTASANGMRSRFVEPAIVGGIVAGLTIIFFANRDVGN